MMFHIPEVFSKPQVSDIRQALEQASWVDGASTAGAQAQKIKRNLQLPSDSPVTAQFGKVISQALGKHPLFISAVLPQHILPPLFNRYEVGGSYGNHVDSAIHYDAQLQCKVRTDVSITVFLSEPEEYAGGDLVIEDSYGAHEVKLPAGDVIIYPSTSVHRVEPVTQGVRLAAFSWAQSMVRDDGRRSMLFDLDMTILKLRQQLADSPEVVSLTNHYHNLLRQWAEL